MGGCGLGSLPVGMWVEVRMVGWLVGRSVVANSVGKRCCLVHMCSSAVGEVWTIAYTSQIGPSGLLFSLSAVGLCGRNEGERLNMKRVNGEVEEIEGEEDDGLEKVDKEWFSVVGELDKSWICAIDRI